MFSIIIGLFMLASCGVSTPTTSSGGSTSSSSTQEILKMKYVDVKVYNAVYVAIEEKIFEKNGLELELVELVAGGPAGIQLVSSGSADAGLSALMAIVNASNAGLPVIGVADLQSAVKDVPLEIFYVRKDSGINNINDLKGKKVAVNALRASFHYTWIIALEKAGMKETDVEFVTLPFGQQELALQNKTVDAIGLLTPFSGMANTNNELKVLFRDLDVFGEKQFSLHFVNSEWARKNPETVRRFVKSLREASAFVEANQDRAREIISKYTGVDAKFITDYKFQPNAQVVKEDVEFWLDFMKKYDSNIKKELSFKDVATNEFNEAVGGK